MIKSKLAVLALAAVLGASGAALAQKAPAAKHGGQTAVVAGHHDAELVIKPNQLVLYLTNHGKALVPADNAIKATIQDGANKTEVLMQAEGDHAVAALAAPINKGAVIVIAGKISGGHAMTARFVTK